MTINTGQFGGVFWHDSEKGEMEVSTPGHPNAIQGMLFHPLTGTGIHGDPLLKPGERANDVHNAFGTSIPELEKSGMPRALLGTPETNPTIRPLDRRRRTSAATYDPKLNIISLRDDDDDMGGESLVHELGHSQDKTRLIRNQVSKMQPYHATSEGAADAYRDRFSSENIMTHEGMLDPLLNRFRAHEIMEEPISFEGGYTRLRGYGGRSHVWRNKMEQASYAVDRMRGALKPTGRAHYSNMINRDLYSASRALSDTQLTAAQIGKGALLDNTHNNVPNQRRWKSRGEVTHAETLEVGRKYKNNESVRVMLDQADLGDAGAFAAKVHDLHIEGIRHKAWNARAQGRKLGKAVDENPTLQNDPAQRTQTIDYTMSVPDIDPRTKRTFSQPSFFDNDPTWDPEPVITQRDEITPAWMKKNKIKKPARRKESQWLILKKQHQDQQKEQRSMFDW